MRIISGRWRGHPLKAPSGRDVRPTSDRVKEAWMSMLGDHVVDARILDLFAGSGSLGLECLSRGARRVVFVERAGPALKSLRANLDALTPDAGAAEVVRADAMELVEEIEEPFDIALADPPYGRGLARRLLEVFREKPFARELWVEHGTREELPDLPGLESRRYGDTTLTRIDAPIRSRNEADPAGPAHADPSTGTPSP
ncbi:MAG: 16S rRNA (guanine(966)-N(2))-methyltransferase RsmD [Longimicrobiales bacterium]|nr:16S rRNA (guanine(966)-N(2))-methyltransferase RsmD [Longimicrobiales bacterium]